MRCGAVGSARVTYLSAPAQVQHLLSCLPVPVPVPALEHFGLPHSALRPGGPRNNCGSEAVRFRPRVSAIRRPRRRRLIRDELRLEPADLQTWASSFHCCLSGPLTPGTRAVFWSPPSRLCPRRGKLLPSGAADERGRRQRSRAGVSWPCRSRRRRRR